MVCALFFPDPRVFIDGKSTKQDSLPTVGSEMTRPAKEAYTIEEAVNKVVDLRTARFVRLLLAPVYPRSSCTKDASFFPIGRRSEACSRVLQRRKPKSWPPALFCQPRRVLRRRNQVLPPWHKIRNGFQNPSKKPIGLLQSTAEGPVT